MKFFIPFTMITSIISLSLIVIFTFVSRSTFVLISFGVCFIGMIIGAVGLFICDVKKNKKNS